MVTNLGHVGLICDDFFKMRDFYTRVIGLTVTDEDPDRGSCFLSADLITSTTSWPWERRGAMTTRWDPGRRPPASDKFHLLSRAWTI